MKGTLMPFSFCSFSSGSSGNSYLVRTRTTALIVDAGISTKRILSGLSDTQTPTELVSGLLLTHEHSDHVKSLGTLSKKLPQMGVYATPGTWAGIEEAGISCGEQSKRFFHRDETFQVGDITVKAFPVSHDARDPVGFSFFHGGNQISIITDTGYLSEEMLAEVAGARILVLEANHDIEMLKFGRYPWFLKQRVLGREGHLSNIAAGEALLTLLNGSNVDQVTGEIRNCSTEQTCVVLAHLSKENNFPEMAYQTIKNILEENQYYIGKHISLNTLIRDELSSIYSIE